LFIAKSEITELPTRSLLCVLVLPKLAFTDTEELSRLHKCGTHIVSENPTHHGRSALFNTGPGLVVYPSTGHPGDRNEVGGNCVWSPALSQLLVS